jgi:hypothetical protein
MSVTTQGARQLLAMAWRVDCQALDQHHPDRSRNMAFPLDHRSWCFENEEM